VRTTKANVVPMTLGMPARCTELAIGSRTITRKAAKTSGSQMILTWLAAHATTPAMTKAPMIVQTMSAARRTRSVERVSVTALSVLSG
jgi:hypothetical protein